MSSNVCMLLGTMQRWRKVVLAACFLALTGCSSNNDNAHTTATTIVPPPVRQQLRVEIRPVAKVDGPKVEAEPAKPLLVFNMPNGKTFGAKEDVVIAFYLANAKTKGDGGDYRVRYIVDDEEMQWIDRTEQVVLSGWTSGKHTIRLELVGPDGWPVDQDVAVREFTITK